MSAATAPAPPPVASGGRIVNVAIDELAGLDRWVLWKLEHTKGRPKPTKVPYCVGGRFKANSTDPKTWDTFEAAWASAFVDGQGHGIGFVVDGSDEIMASDLDACLNENGTVATWALDAVAKLDSYTEVSPSGTGLRVFFTSAQGQDWGLNPKGEPVGGRVVNYRGGKIEIYRQERFLTITGSHLPGTPEDIREVAPETIASLLGPPPRAKPNGAAGAREELVEVSAIFAVHSFQDLPEELRARFAAALQSNAKLKKRWEGDGTGLNDSTRSGYDFALASLLRREGFSLQDFGMLARVWQHGKGHDGDIRHYYRCWERTSAASSNGSATEDDAAPQAVQGDALLDLSHDGLALDMGRLWQPDARHVALWGKWIFWNSATWQADEKLDHLTRTRRYLRGRADALVRDTRDGEIDWGESDPRKALAKAEKTAKELRSAPMVNNIASLARSNPELVAIVEQWDGDPFVAGTPNRSSIT